MRKWRVNDAHLDSQSQYALPPLRILCLTFCRSKSASPAWNPCPGHWVHIQIFFRFHKTNTIQSHDLHKNYVDLHNESRRYRDKVRRTNALRKELGRSLIRGRPVEMVNFQDPQVRLLAYF